METLQIREAKASFSALVAAAEKGRPTIISRHGHPCAMIVSIADGKRLYPFKASTLAAYLLEIPELLDTERDMTPLQSIDL